MNNEPVAWMLADKEAEHIRSIMAVQHDFVPEGCIEIALYTHPVEEEHFEDEPQAEELHEIMQSNTYPVKEQDESFDRTASHMAGEYVSYKAELTDEEIGQFKGEWYRNGYASFYDLVKAILRKAQE